MTKVVNFGAARYEAEPAPVTEGMSFDYGHETTPPDYSGGTPTTTTTEQYGTRAPINYMNQEPYAPPTSDGGYTREPVVNVTPDQTPQPTPPPQPLPPPTQQPQPPPVVYPNPPTPYPTGVYPVPTPTYPSPLQPAPTSQTHFVLFGRAIPKWAAYLGAGGTFFLLLLLAFASGRRRTSG